MTTTTTNPRQSSPLSGLDLIEVEVTDNPVTLYDADGQPLLWERPPFGFT